MKYWWMVAASCASDMSPQAADQPSNWRAFTTDRSGRGESNWEGEESCNYQCQLNEQIHGST